MPIAIQHMRVGRHRHNQRPVDFKGIGEVVGVLQAADRFAAPAVENAVFVMLGQSQKHLGAIGGQGRMRHLVDLGAGPDLGDQAL